MRWSSLSVEQLKENGQLGLTKSEDYQKQKLRPVTL